MANGIVNEIDSILLMNRNILKENYFEGKTKISKTALIEAGFKFSYHTSEIRNQEIDHVFEFSYDFGIGKLEDDIYEIISIHNLFKTK